MVLRRIVVSSLAEGLSLLLAFSPIVSSQTKLAMTDDDVVAMVRAGKSAREITDAIYICEAYFKLDQASISVLTHAGVSDEIIRAMAARQNRDAGRISPAGGVFTIQPQPTPQPSSPSSQSPSVVQPIAQPSPPLVVQTTMSSARPVAPPTQIPEGTRLRVRLEQQLSSATADEGQPVQLSVTDDVVANGAVVFAQGATVTGTVVTAVPKRRMGRTGKLDFSIDRAMAVDGGSVPLRYSMVKKEGGSHAVRTGVITAGVAVLFWPAAPFFLLMKGKDTVINKGMIFEVFTDAAHSTKASTEIATAPVSSASATVNITSDPSGADIEVDDSFVGSSPSVLQLSAGDHKIQVTKGTKSWEKTIRVSSGSNLNITAALEEKRARQ